MSGISRRRICRRFLLTGVVLLTLGASSVRAQWGPGWGWGFGGFNYVSHPTDFLNQKALIDATRDTGRPSSNPYQGSANPYYLHVRDNGFVPSYDVERRQPPAYREAPSAYLAERPRRQPLPQGGPDSGAGGVVPRPVVPLASFFDASHRLVWPTDAPVAGDLKRLRDVSDKASLVAFEEVNIRGKALIATVADARQKLLDYGRPALKEVRSTATSRVADTFHLFLLSLYESLAQAANPLETASAPASPPR